MAIIGYNVTPSTYRTMSDVLSRWQDAGQRYTIVSGDTLTKVALFSKDQSILSADLIIADYSTGDIIHTQSVGPDLSDNVYKWIEVVLSVDLSAHAGKEVYISLDKTTASALDTRYDPGSTGGTYRTGTNDATNPMPTTGWNTSTQVPSYYAEITSGAASFAIDSAPTTYREGEQFSITVSNPATVPTINNTIIEFI